jgi:hypothetical protein
VVIGGIRGYPRVMLRSFFGKGRSFNSKIFQIRKRGRNLETKNTLRIQTHGVRRMGYIQVTDIPTLIDVIMGNDHPSVYIDSISTLILHKKDILFLKMVNKNIYLATYGWSRLPWVDEVIE